MPRCSIVGLITLLFSWKFLLYCSFILFLDAELFVPYLNYLELEECVAKLNAQANFSSRHISRIMFIGNIEIISTFMFFSWEANRYVNWFLTNSIYAFQPDTIVSVGNVMRIEEYGEKYPVDRVLTRFNNIISEQSRRRNFCKFSGGFDNRMLRKYSETHQIHNLFSNYSIVPDGCCFKDDLIVIKQFFGSNDNACTDFQAYSKMVRIGVSDGLMLSQGSLPENSHIFLSKFAPQIVLSTGGNGRVVLFCSNCFNLIASTEAQFSQYAVDSFPFDLRLPQFTDGGGSQPHFLIPPATYFARSAALTGHGFPILLIDHESQIIHVSVLWGHKRHLFILFYAIVILMAISKLIFQLIIKYNVLRLFTSGFQ